MMINNKDTTEFLQELSVCGDSLELLLHCVMCCLTNDKFLMTVVMMSKRKSMSLLVITKQAGGESNSSPCRLSERSRLKPGGL